MAIFKNGFTSADRTLLLRQLGLLTGNGLSLLDALQRLAQNNESPRVQAFCRKVLDKKDDPQHFGGDSRLKFMQPLLQVLDREGIQKEKMSQALYEMADVNETTAGFRLSIATALVYPAKLFLIALILWTVILVFVIPVFESMFTDFGSALPHPTQTVLVVSRIFQHHIVFIIAILVAILFLIIVERRTQRIFLWFFPSLRGLAKKMDVIHFSHLLSIFLSIGQPLKDAVGNAATAMPMSAFSPRLQKMDPNLATPMQLTEALKNTGLFPTMLLGLTSLAEKVEVLPEIFKKSALYLCKGLDGHMARAIKTFEMVMFFIVAVVIGSMVIAMYLPIFKLASVVSG